MKYLLALALFTAWPISAEEPVQTEAPAIPMAWEPSEADVLQVKLLSYLHFQTKDTPDFQLTRMTWYDNPPDAELPGIVVSVEYTAPSDPAGIRCGTLMWHKLADGDFALIRDQDKPISMDAQKNSKSPSVCSEP